MSVVVSEGAVLRVVAGGDPTRISSICDTIREAGHDLVRVVPTSPEVIRAVLVHEPDVLIFEFNRVHGLDILRQINSERMIPAVALVEPIDVPSVRVGLREFALAYAVSPVSRRELEAAMFVAIARMEAQQELRTENEKLRRLLENRKVIERAKGVLMKRFRWSENDAFRRLQRSAMNHRTSMAQLAQAVLSGDSVQL